MIRRIAAHLGRNIYGLIAIVIALGGTAYAAATIGAGDIKPNAVRAKHIKDGHVRGAEVRDSALTGADVDDDTLTGSDIDETSLSGVNAAALNGAIVISDQDSAGAGQSGPLSLGQIPGVGHFEIECDDPVMQMRFVSEFGGGNLAVIQDNGGADALYEEIANGAATTWLTTTTVDAAADIVTYRIHRGQQAAPEVETPKATITVTARRGSDTIPDLCNYTVQGIAQP
jgi:hypothetical protein